MQREITASYLALQSIVKGKNKQKRLRKKFKLLQIK